MSKAAGANGGELAALLDAHSEKLAEQIVVWRRHLHERPELSFQESETSAFIRERLAEIGGFEVSQPTATSVRADLRGGRPGPTVALRSDHDALPIEEDTGLPFASKNPGVMHACGHDGHTAMMLGVATVLAAVREQLPGNVRILFEHGEEALPGGASQMVAAGAMEGVDRVLGQHLWATCRCTYTRGYRAVVNDEASTAVVERVAREALGEEAVTRGELVLGGEDFSALQACAPGTFLLLGARNEERGIVHDHHNPRFDVDESAFPIGVRLISRAAVALLEDAA